ncbi:MAG: immune inhibitor A [Anaerolineales bacterium]
MEQEQNFFTTTAGIVTVVIVLLCCCCLAVAAGGFGGLLWLGSQAAPPYIDEPPTYEYNTPSPFNPNPVATPTAPVITRPALDEISTETLETLKNTIVPENDPRELACRLKNICNVPETFPQGPFEVGAQKQFWVMNVQTIEYRQLTANLAYKTDVAYFWVEEGVRFSQSEAKDLVDAFSQKMVPTNREFFGMEPSPGIDGDPHIYLLYARGIGGSTAGYFSSSDAQHPLVNQYSNGHEMFVFNADNSPLADPYTYGVLAHEFQHMIHFGRDRNETSWLNEGFSELAVLLNHYSTGFKDSSYLSRPDLQLTDWGPDVGQNAPYYGASFLFTTYFLQRFGEQATQALVREADNSMDSVDKVLDAIGATDPRSGQPIRANDLFMDWAIANYLLDQSVGDGRYAYQRYQPFSKAAEARAFTTCPAEYSDTVNQYGVDYIRFSCKGKYTLRFEGSTATTLLPADAYSGKYAFWSNKGDESDMTLTREFDFRSVTGPLTLNYRIWYDIEEGWDYAYLQASSDGGQTWQILLTPSGTAEDPAGNAYGWGYTGSSSGWIEESVDLSQLAGQTVLLRFEYITDAAVNGEGIMVDDISIPEINYFDDFETGANGWQAEGFVRIENLLPQTFRLALIRKGGQTTVETITVNPDQTAEINLDLGGDTREVILLVSGTTRFTRSVGSYLVTVK